MKRNLIITIIIITQSLIPYITFWYSSDCSYVKDYNWELKLPDSMKSMYESSLWKELLTENWMIRAIRNLKKYCCFDTEQLKWDTNCEKSKYDDIENDYPKSPYLIDHIVSVMERRLSNSYTWVEMDEKASEWYEFFNNYSKKKEWATPTEFTAKYKEYRYNDNSREISSESKINTKVQKYKISYYDGTSAWEYINVIESWKNGSSRKDSDKYNNLKSRDLTTKYNNICQTAVYLTMKQGRFDSDDEELLNKQKECVDKINKKLSELTKYFSNIIKTQSNSLAQRILTKYNENITNKKENSNAKIWIANTYWWWVMRMIQQVTLKCN